MWASSGGRCLGNRVTKTTFLSIQIWNFELFERCWKIYKCQTCTNPLVEHLFVQRKSHMYDSQINISFTNDVCTLTKKHFWRSSAHVRLSVKIQMRSTKIVLMDYLSPFDFSERQWNLKFDPVGHRIVKFQGLNRSSFIILYKPFAFDITGILVSFM